MKMFKDHKEAKRVMLAMIINGYKKMGQEVPADIQYNSKAWLGWGLNEFIAHYDAQAAEWMCADNRIGNAQEGRRWNTDHILPYNVCKKYGITDMRIVLSLHNIYPCCAEVNTIKSDRIGRFDSLEQFRSAPMVIENTPAFMLNVIMTKNLNDGVYINTHEKYQVA